MAVQYKVLARSASDLDVMIYGDIGDTSDIWGESESVETQAVIEDIAKSKASLINVRINSGGGLVSDAVAIYNALLRHPAQVTAHVDGIAYSAASVVAMAGQNIQMAETAMMMLHGPSTAARGNERTMLTAADVLKRWKVAMAAAYSRNGKGPSEADIKRWLDSDEDTYFSADEALAENLVDSIVPIDEGAETATPISGAPVVLKNGGKVMAEQKDGKSGEGEGEGAVVNTPDAQTRAVEYIAGHQDAVSAGERKGAELEQARQKRVRACFYNRKGAFAFGDEADKTDPFVALMNSCLSDVRCDEADTRGHINACFREGYTPIGNPLQAAQAHEGTSYPAASAASRSGIKLGGWGDAHVIRDAGDAFVQGASLALSVRAGIEKDKEKVAEARKHEYLAMSLTDLCREQLRVSGASASGNREDIVRRVLAASGPGQGSDHFSNILQNIANKSIMDRFEGAEESWRQWTQQGTLQDYREASRVNKSLFDVLDKMEEHEPFKAGRFADVKQTIQGFLYGKVFSLTLQAMVNDDLNLLTEDMGAWGEAASVAVGDAVWLAISLAGASGYGQTMTEDSTILFHANHSNYIASGSGAVPSSATIQAGRTAMLTQTDPNSRTVASRPRYILHGTTLTPAVWALLNSFQRITGEDATVPDLNWVASTGLVQVEDYRFDSWISTAWMLAAARRTVEVAFVQGQSEPRVDRMATSPVPGISWEISIPFGVTALDFRTLYLNYGA